ncbi:MAG: M48 family metallopeptidase [Bacteroidales bacterium]|nr:M48 family metallopeptidase [Bacteroidales bacterium]
MEIWRLRRGRLIRRSSEACRARGQADAVWGERGAYHLSQHPHPLGSCNHRTGRINLSLYLLLLPELCIEHVVAHELTHLLVPNHSPQFYATLGRYFPRYKEARLLSKRWPTRRRHDHWRIEKFGSSDFQRDEICVKA